MKKGGKAMKVMNVGSVTKDSNVFAICPLCDCEGCIREVDNDHCSCCDWQDWFDVND
jgi:hypothetical protein